MSEQQQWYKRQLRILQTVLREPDVVGYDAKSVADYMKAIHANCLVINGGGIVDFFRHDLANANPNPFMTNEDILRDLMEVCRKEGIRVIVRVDFRGVDKRIYDLNPDWFSQDEEGQPIYWANSKESPYPLYTPCYLSYYRNGHAFQFAEHLMKTYDVDGIWENSPFQLGACYCRTCRQQYEQDTGKPIPRGGQFQDSQYDEYREWKALQLNKHLHDFRKTVKTFGEDKIYCAEIFGLFYNQFASTSSDLYQVKDDFDFLVTPLFTGNHQPLSAPSTLVKFLHGLEPDKVPIMLFGHLGSNNELRYVASPAAETRIWMWQAVSAGGSLWNCIFNGHHPGATFDRRNAQLCKDVYTYMEKHEDKLHGQNADADVVIYYSRSSNNKFGNGDRSKDAYITHIIGMEQALISMNLQYRFLLDTQLSAEELSGVRVLVIPNGACLSVREINLIKQYVQQGGKVIATNETSLYDETGRQREDFGLAEVFGCTYTGVKKDASHYGYQYIRDHGHALTKGLEQTELLANWGENLLVRVQPNSGVESPITFVPQIFPQSPERAWPKTFETDFPTCIVNRYGQGEAIYFPYGVDKQVWSHGHDDFRILLGNAFGYMLNGRQKVVSNAPDGVHITLNRVAGEERQWLLHLINTVSPSGRPVRQVVPLQELVVELELEGSELLETETLYGAKADVAVIEKAKSSQTIRLHVKLDRLEEYSSVYIQLA